MAEEDTLHRCLTKFMLNTSQYRTGANLYATRAAVASWPIGAVYGDSVDMFVSGSIAEFYIKPPLSCIGDIDIMIDFNGHIAIPTGHCPPTELPAHFPLKVKVYDIIDSRQPGYVYLRLSHVIKKSDNGHYFLLNEENESVYASTFLPAPLYNFSTDLIHKFPNAKQNELIENVKNVIPMFVGHDNISVESLLSGMTLRIVNQGPAQKYKTSLSDSSIIEQDVVSSVRCFEWPPQAGQWPTRSRTHGWPDPATIREVVSNGCDVVHAAHPFCRRNEWMREHQWRLSFSRAEVVLINSWTPVQQIIYHMLRFVMKREILQKIEGANPELPKLSNYHIKTLMLWECELKPQSWWSAESSLVKLCNSLIHKLAGLVAERHCPHYFISNCNLFDHFEEDNFVVIGHFLSSFADETFLLSWFIGNYVNEYAQQCPPYVSAKFNNNRYVADFNEGMNAIIDWKSRTATIELVEERRYNEAQLLIPLLSLRIDANGFEALVKQLQNFSPHLVDYAIAMSGLRVAKQVLAHSLTADLLEALWNLFNPSIGDTYVTRHDLDIMTCIQKAIKLAANSNVRSNSVEILHNEMAKAYLHHSFNYAQEFTYDVVHVLLAVLYYKSGHYQEATDHGKQVMYSSQTIRVEFLPQIDENADAVLGLIVLYEYLHKNVAKERNDLFEIGNQTTFTIEFLACYIISKCCSDHCTDTACDLAINRQHLRQAARPLLSDVILFKTFESQVNNCSYLHVRNRDTGESCSNAQMDTGLLVSMIEVVALEKLITYRHVMISELRSEQFPILSEFEAVHAYKCGLFDECLKICRSQLDELFRSNCEGANLYRVPLCSLLSFMDGELVSLAGVISLCRSDAYSFIKLNFWGICLTTLLLYLMAQCQKKFLSVSVTDTLSLIRFVHDEALDVHNTAFHLDRLVLKMTYRSLKLYADDALRAR